MLSRFLPVAMLSTSDSMKGRLCALRTEFADLAYQLERQGRCDAADVVMRIDARVRELLEAGAPDDSGDIAPPCEPALSSSALRSSTR